MFKFKRQKEDNKLLEQKEKKLNTAANKAVKEAKNIQEVIIANGFTLELLLKMGVKHD